MLARSTWLISYDSIRVFKCYSKCIEIFYFPYLSWCLLKRFFVVVGVNLFLVSLQQNHIGDDGVSHLSEALKVNTTLTTLGYDMQFYCNLSLVYRSTILQ